MKGMRRGIELVKRVIDNQALGLLPLLTFMILDNFLSYLVSFLIGVVICFICVLVFQVLIKNHVYWFMLLPSTGTLVLYGGFLSLRLDPILFIYTPLITEILLVVCLAIVGFTRASVLKHVRNSNRSKAQKTLLRMKLNEFYFVSELVQNVFTLHLFVILLYSFFGDTFQTNAPENFLYRYMGATLGVLVIIYEQIRLTWMRGSLQKEMWLPVLDEKGKIVGRIARSVSRSLVKKYFHPVVRIAVIYGDMLYLVKRGSLDYVFPNALDYPFHQYVRWGHSVEGTVKDTIGKLGEDKSIKPRFLIRYTYEDERVKHLVSLYTICVRTEEQLEKCKRPTGKLWTAKQIEDNLGTGVFSGYFEKEFPYLQTTVLLAQRIYREHGGPKPSDSAALS